MSGFMLCGSGEPLPFLTVEDLAAEAWCCYGAVDRGPGGCNCWTPIFDLRQRKVRTDVEPETRASRCHDCAYRPDSPERQRGEALEALPNFWCHQGIRRPKAFRHPDGRVRPVEDSADYQPPMVAGVPYRASGRPADRCAGWAQVQRLRERQAVPS
ncbi:MAG: hypothetical protein V4515_12245 [Chloroflexota bacterium]